jgi:hypothetical protein
MKKQSVRERRSRLAKGRCPTHGLGMSQVEGWYKLESGHQYIVVGCPRKDCRIRAKAYSIDGPWKLLPVNQELDGVRI